MSVLIDTNMLLRRAQPSHPSHYAAVEAIARHLARNDAVFFTPQNITEFWNVATRPTANNGLGLAHEIVLNEIAAIEGFLNMLPESPAIYPEWKRLVLQHQVTGAKVYDARLVAVANVYGVGSILTFNVADFKRYGSVNVLEPAAFLSETT